MTHSRAAARTQSGIASLLSAALLLASWGPSAGSAAAQAAAAGKAAGTASVPAAGAAAVFAPAPARQPSLQGPSLPAASLEAAPLHLEPAGLAPALARAIVGEAGLALARPSALALRSPAGVARVASRAAARPRKIAAAEKLRGEGARSLLASARRHAAALGASSLEDAPAESVETFPEGPGLRPAASKSPGGRGQAVARALAAAPRLAGAAPWSLAAAALAVTAAVTFAFSASPAGLLLAAVPLVAAVSASDRPQTPAELLRELSAKHAGGGAFDPAAESTPRTRAALAELEAQGFLAPTADGKRVLVDFGGGDSKEPRLAGALRLAQAASAALARPGAEDVVIGLLKDAAERLDGERSSQASAAAERIGWLAASAAARLWDAAAGGSAAPRPFLDPSDWRAQAESLAAAGKSAVAESAGSGGSLHRSHAAKHALETLERVVRAPAPAAPETEPEVEPEPESGAVRLDTLAVTVVEADDATRARWKIPEGHGVVITELEAPAADNRFRVGDVLSVVNQLQIPRPASMRRWLAEQPIGTPLVFTVHRGDSQLSYELAAREPIPAPAAARATKQPIHDLPQFLKHFATNMSEKAAQGKFDPVFGRDAEIQRIATILGRRKKPNIILVGNPGVGKTSVVEGLAQWIADHPESPLHGRNVINLNIASVVAGTQLRGMFEDRMQNIVRELREKPDKFIVFIDEIHNIMGAGSALGAPQDAAELLKPVLAGGEVLSIGATTADELPLLEKDKAFLRRFQVERLGAPSPAMALEILRGSRSRYEEHHGVAIAEEALAAAVELGPRHFTDNSLPDSALDLIDDAASTVRARTLAAEREGRLAPSAVLAADIYREVSRRTGVPLGDLVKDERARLLELEEGLNRRVVGQRNAAARLAQAIRLGRLGYKPVEEPQGLFLFLGPTGVGKTEMARRLAELLFDSPDAMTRVDMSEYAEGNLSKLIGSAAGHADSEEEGLLTGSVRRKPYQVVLLDEIDKAHPAVLNLLLQMAAGHLTDGRRRKVSFANTVIIMTSNHGGAAGVRKRSASFLEPQSRRDPAAADQARYLRAATSQLAPELVGRIGMDRMIVFDSLGEPEFRRILELRMEDLNRSLKPKGLTVRLAVAAALRAIQTALSLKTYGARPLRDVVQRDVAGAMADAELAGTIQRGDSVVVDVEGERYTAKPE